MVITVTLSYVLQNKKKTYKHMYVDMYVVTLECMRKDRIRTFTRKRS